MQTIPSLIGSGTAVAAAATGLVFGELPDQPSAPPPLRPSTSIRTESSRRRTLLGRESSKTTAQRRPGTTATLISGGGEELDHSASNRAPSPILTSRSDTTPPKRSGWRPSTSRKTGDTAESPNSPNPITGTPPIPENSSDSITLSAGNANTSWVRRLSRRPNSQHGSVRSCIGNETPSVFSHGSAAPILAPTSQQIPLAPNKLVKRAFAQSGPQAEPLVPPVSKTQRLRTQLPTLRRPATSHQRSATLQQNPLSPSIVIQDLSPLVGSSSYQQSGPQARTVTSPLASPICLSPTCASPPYALMPLESSSYDNSNWRSFFHDRVTRFASKTSTLRRDSTSPTIMRRILADPNPQRRAYLVRPRCVSADARVSKTAWDEDGVVDVDLEGSPKNSSGRSKEMASRETTPKTAPAKSPRRSVSLTFKGPTSWISKPGSISRRKRGASDVAEGEKRHVSDSDAVITESRTDCHTDEKETDTDFSWDSGKKEEEPTKAESNLTAIFQPPKSKPRTRHRRNSSTPLPSLNPTPDLPVLHIEANRRNSVTLSSRPMVNMAGGIVDSEGSPHSPPIGSPHGTFKSLRINSNGSQARTLDRASTVASSEYHHGFTSGDDDDNNTETPYDSLRTIDSFAPGKARDSPLESMFDDSPPNTSSTSHKPKHLSIKEILGSSFDKGNRIMEEDETLSTPIFGTYEEANASFRLTNLDNGDNQFAGASPLSKFPYGPRDGSSVLPDEENFEWTNDELESSTYSKGCLSPTELTAGRWPGLSQRVALGDINGNGASEIAYDATSERPRSTVFDWTDSASHDKHDGDCESLRPKTVHGKQAPDMRGGRSAARKGVMVAHVRSQSVPIVPDLADASKSIPKFGTWGLSSKNVSEDWDDDFEFEEEPEPNQSDGRGKLQKSVPMIVPASIQATQPTVKAHSGQIRELSLLVNDLKRLCRLGKEMGIFAGPSQKLWREAEGIIALASPDDDESEDSASTETSPVDSETSSVDEQFVDEGLDGCALAQPKHAVAHADTMELSESIPKKKQRSLAGRRSVFASDDNIFGEWPPEDDQTRAGRPKTPETSMNGGLTDSSSVARSIMESMRSCRKQYQEAAQNEGSTTKVNFDMNSLKELVKRAGDLRDALSDIVRRADHITSSPIRTPRREQERKRKEDGSPAFTRVFDEPTASPTRRIPASRSSNSVLSGGSAATSPSSGLGQRVRMMTVS